MSFSCCLSVCFTAVFEGLLPREGRLADAHSKIFVQLQCVFVTCRDTNRSQLETNGLWTQLKPERDLRWLLSVGSAAPLWARRQEGRRREARKDEGKPQGDEGELKGHTREPKGVCK